MLSNTSQVNLDLLVVFTRGVDDICSISFESAGTTWFQVKYLVTDDCD